MLNIFEFVCNILSFTWFCWALKRLFLMRAAHFALISRLLVPAFSRYRHCHYARTQIRASSHSTIVAGIVQLLQSLDTILQHFLACLTI